MTRTNRRNPLANPRRKGRLAAAVAVAVASAALLAACSSADAATPATSPAATLRLGFFDNITHGPALVGLQSGTLQSALGSTKLSAQIFNAGPAEIEALTAGAIDAAYIGPSPAINSYIKSHGESLKIVAGATNGGASLVVAPGITSAADLKGKTLASPAARQHAGCRAALLAEVEGLPDAGLRFGGCDHQPDRQRPDAGPVRDRQARRGVAARAVGVPARRGCGRQGAVDEASLWPKKTIPDHGPRRVEAVPRRASADRRGPGQGQRGCDHLAEHAQAGGGRSTEREAESRHRQDPVPSGHRPRPRQRHLLGRSRRLGVPDLVSHAVAVGTGKAGSIKGLLDLSALNSLRAKAGLSAISTGGE